LPRPRLLFRESSRLLDDRPVAPGDRIARQCLLSYPRVIQGGHWGGRK
jgi:hypothetical protein